MHVQNQKYKMTDQGLMLTNHEHIIKSQNKNDFRPDRVDLSHFTQIILTTNLKCEMYPSCPEKHQHSLSV